MKESLYNVYLLDEKSEKCLVFNTMHRTIVQIDKKLYYSIKDKKIDQIRAEFLQGLKNGRIIVDSNYDERD